MKGLLIKDIKLLLGQRRFFMAVLLFSLFFMITNKNPLFSISYMTMLFSIFTLSTISYDEFDKGMSFLMTLPINRKIYVGEKYIFAGMITFISAIVSSVFAIGMSNVMEIAIEMQELLATGVAIMALAGLILAFMIPIELKFGAEKGRIAMILVMGVIFVVGFLLVKCIEYLGIDVTVFFVSLMELDIKLLVGLAFIIWCVLIFISYLVCVKIMEKKEF